MKEQYHWQIFTLNGYRYARRIPNPSDPGMPPLGATDVYLSVAHPIRDPFAGEHEPTTEEKRAWFKQGWSESGADPAKADAMFNAIEQGKAHTLLDISDFDDSPNALGLDPALAELEREIDGL